VKWFNSPFHKLTYHAIKEKDEEERNLNVNIFLEIIFKKEITHLAQISPSSFPINISYKKRCQKPTYHIISHKTNVFSFFQNFGR